MSSPFSTASDKPDQVTPIRWASPSPSMPAHSVRWSPARSSATSSRSGPMRSLGPGRSWRMATGRPARPAAERMRSTFSSCSSRLPWEKFRRATSAPASIIRASVSESRHAGPMVTTIFVRRTTTESRPSAGSARDERSVLHHGLAVGAQPAAVAQVADQIPVQRGLVRPARLGIRAPEREVDGSADLLVEQDRARGAVDAEVRAHPELAQAAGAGVGGQRALQVLVALLGPGGDDLAAAQLELDAGHGQARRAGGNGAAHPPLRRVLDRPGEDLAAGHVAPAVGVAPGAAVHAQPQ